jgi:hypothetical protein
MATATKKMGQGREFGDYLVRKATYSRKLADAAMSHLEAGGSIRLTTYCQSTTYFAESVRRVGDEIQLYEGRRRRLDSWVPMNPDQLARQMGMPTFLDTEIDAK